MVGKTGIKKDLKFSTTVCYSMCNVIYNVEVDTNNKLRILPMKLLLNQPSYEAKIWIT